MHRTAAERLAGLVRAHPGQLRRRPGPTGRRARPAHRRRTRSRRGGESRRGPDRTLADAFGRRRRDRPDAVAVTCGRHHAHLRRAGRARANRLAHELIARGVRPESRVAVALPRVADLIVALLAVVKAGGCYVPLDIGSPAARLSTSSPTRPRLRPDRPATGLPAGSAPPVVLVAGRCTAARRRRAEPALIPTTPPTSSTPPAPPAGPRASWSPTATCWRCSPPPQALFDFGPDDVWTMFHSYAFDFSVWELWGALLHGGRLVVVAARRGPRPAAASGRCCAAERVTVLNQTPSAFYPLIEADRGRAGPSCALRYVVFGGEALDLSPARRLVRPPRRARPRLVNMYGITETTVHVSFRALAPRDDVDRPQRHRRRAARPARPRARPRTCSRSRRAWPARCTSPATSWPAATSDRPGADRARFVANPFDAAGERLYRSGDLAPLDRGRRAGLPGPLRPPGEGPRLPHRAGRDRVGAAVPGRRRERRRVDAPGRPDAPAGRLPGRPRGTGPTSTRCGRSSPTALPDYMVPGRVRDAGRAAADRQRQAGPRRPARTRVRDGAAPRRRGRRARRHRAARRCSPRSSASRGRRRRRLLRPRRRQHRRHPAGQPGQAQRRAAVTPRRVRPPHPGRAGRAATVPADAGAVAGTTPGAERRRGRADCRSCTGSPNSAAASTDCNQAELLRTPAGATIEQLDAAARRPGRPPRRAAAAAAPAGADAVVPGNRGRPPTFSTVDGSTSPGLDDAALRDAIAAQSDAAADRLDPDAGRRAAGGVVRRGARRAGPAAARRPPPRGRRRVLADPDRGPGGGLSARRGRAATRAAPRCHVAAGAFATPVTEHAQQAARLAEFEHWTVDPRARRRTRRRSRRRSA